MVPSLGGCIGQSVFSFNLSVFDLATVDKANGKVLVFSVSKKF